MFLYTIRVVTFWCFILLSLSSSSQLLTIYIEGVRHNQGVIRLAFYQNDAEFKADKPFRSEALKKDTLASRLICVTYSDLKSGAYGIALLDDENENCRMDYKLLIPKEGFGFSNFFPECVRRPKFDEFKFNLNQLDKTVYIRVKYF